VSTRSDFAERKDYSKSDMTHRLVSSCYSHLLTSSYPTCYIISKQSAPPPSSLLLLNLTTAFYNSSN